MPKAAVGPMTMLVNFRDLAIVNVAYMFLGGSGQTYSVRNPPGEPIARASGFRDQGQSKRGGNMKACKFDVGSWC
jgi:hypothetical protein